jgi:hypothetical protein
MPPKGYKRKLQASGASQEALKARIRRESMNKAEKKVVDTSSIGGSESDDSGFASDFEWDTWEGEIDKDVQRLETSFPALKQACSHVRADGRAQKERYVGNSRSTLFAKAAQLKSASKGTQKLENFFQAKAMEGEEKVANSRRKNALLYNTLDKLGDEAVVRTIMKLDAELTVSKSHVDNVFDHLRLLSVRKFLQFVQEGRDLIGSSVMVADMVFSGGSFKATCIRSWAKYYLEFGVLLEHRQGKHQKTKSLIDDEDVYNKCRKWLRSQKDGEVMPATFAKYVNETLIPSFTGAPLKNNVTPETCRVWLVSKFDFEYHEHRQGVYFDGHERPDVVEYRGKFLEQMFAYQRRMATFEGDDLSTVVPPELAPGEKQLTQVL